MATEVELPDGTIVEFPDGTDNATMERALAQYAAKSPIVDLPAVRAEAPNFDNVQAKSDTVPDRGYWAQRGHELKGFGQGLRFSVAETAAGAGQMLGAMDDEQVAEFRRKKEAAAAEGGEFFSGGSMVGDGAQAAMPLGAANKWRYAKTLAQGAGLGATRTTQGDESRLANTLWGGALNVGGNLAGDAIGGLAKKAAPEVRQLYQAARGQGINLTPAQLTESDFVKRLAAMTGRLPGSGAVARNTEQAAQFNSRLAGEIGEATNKPLTPAVMGQAYDRLGKQFDAVFAGGMNYDRAFLKDVARIRADAALLDDSAGKVAERFANRIKMQGKNGTMSGTTLQSMDQQVRKWATGGGDRQQIAQELREALHEAYGRQASAGAREAWDATRKQYAIYKTLEPVVARNLENGVPPAQLLGALNATAKGRARMARGEGGDIGVLAQIGQRLKGPTSSGTAENAQSAAAGAGLLTNPLMTLGLLGVGNATGRALNSPKLARYLMSEGRGSLLAPFAPAARPLPLLWGGAAYADEPERP